MFPQASVKDRAGLFLHRISPGIKPSFTLTSSAPAASRCALLSDFLWSFCFTEPVAYQGHGHPAGQNPLLRRCGCSTEGCKSGSGGLCCALRLLWLCRSEVTGLSGRDLGLLLLRRPVYAAGHLPPSSGTRSGCLFLFVRLSVTVQQHSRGEKKR